MAFQVSSETYSINGIPLIRITYPTGGRAGSGGEFFKATSGQSEWTDGDEIPNTVSRAEGGPVGVQPEACFTSIEAAREAVEEYAIDLLQQKIEKLTEQLNQLKIAQANIVCGNLAKYKNLR